VTDFSHEPLNAKKWFYDLIKSRMVPLRKLRDGNQAIAGLKDTK
jgi:hypothetical protein